MTVDYQGEGTLIIYLTVINNELMNWGYAYVLAAKGEPLFEWGAYLRGGAYQT